MDVQYLSRTPPSAGRCCCFFFVQLCAIGSEHASLKEAMDKYEGIRKFPTSKITFNSWFLGFIETQKGIGAALRDKFFDTVYRLAQFIFLDSAEPKVGDK